jgi:hypothetical protein
MSDYSERYNEEQSEGEMQVLTYEGFSRADLIAAIGDWIRRCDKAESELAEALSLCNAANSRIEQLTEQLDAQIVRTIAAEAAQAFQKAGG